MAGGAKLWKKISWAMAAWCGLGAGLVLAVVLALRLEPAGADVPECRPIWMYPSYARVTGFDAKYTKFHKKYSLFLYREHGKDKMPDDDSSNLADILDGIPVLFIPGNAGSYKQVRSIAARASDIDFDNRAAGRHDWRGRNLDFFTAHFNEDFTAFHGRTMLDQAEYLNDAIRFILSLYSNLPNPPKSVILLGHSMGGVVARVMLTLPNYQENSVNTILTLAAPHSLAPATFDGDILQIYSDADKFWRSGFDNGLKTSNTRLQNVSLISITGGLSDTILPADYTTLNGLVPPTNGLTVFTTGIPGVWTPIDHLAIVWCDQLRQVIASTLLKIVDPLSPQRTLPLKQRMEAFHYSLLSGFEDFSARESFSIDKNGLTNRIKISKDTITTETHFNSSSGDYHLLKLWNDAKHTFNLNLLSSSSFSEFSLKPSHAAILACRLYSNTNKALKPIDLHPALNNFEKLDLECVDIHDAIFMTPRSTPGINSLGDSSLGGESAPFHALQINSSALLNQKFNYLLVKESSNSNEFNIIDTNPKHTHQLVLNDSIWKLIFWGIRFDLPQNKGLAVDILIKSAWSSLLNYSLKIKHKNSSHKQAFSPFIRQYIEPTYETKWLLNLDEEKEISFHGVAPFIPFNPNSVNSLHLQYWSPPSDEKITFEINVNIWKSFKLLILRYRLSIVSLPLFLNLIIFAIQYKIYFKTGQFPSFRKGLEELSRKLPLILLLISVLSPLLTFNGFSTIFYYLNPIELMNPKDFKDLKLNFNFLGLHEFFLLGLGPFFIIISFTLVSLVYLIISVSSKLFVELSILLQNNVNFTKSPFFKIHLTPKNRLIFTLVLSVFVMVYIPFQLAFAICCIIQAITLFKILLKVRNLKNFKDKENDKSNVILNSMKNFNFSVLILMIWLIPINVPVLIVFCHNMLLRWKTPFASHHNILSTLPIILFINNNNQLFPTPSTKNKIQQKITLFLIMYFAIFSLIYGIRYLYWLHYLFNILCAWLYILQL